MDKDYSQESATLYQHKYVGCSIWKMCVDRIQFLSVLGQKLKSHVLIVAERLYHLI